MPVLGLVITTHTDRAQAALTAELHRDPRVTVGEAHGMRVPVVVDSGSVADEQAFVRTMEEHPFVAHIEVAFHDFSDVAEVDVTDLSRRRRTGG